jgi:hypothetical protein
MGDRLVKEFFDTSMNFAWSKVPFSLRQNHHDRIAYGAELASAIRRDATR